MGAPLASQSGRGAAARGALLILGVAWEASVHLFKIPKFLLPALSVIWVEFLAGIDLVLPTHAGDARAPYCAGFLLSIVISLPLAI